MNALDALRELTAASEVMASAGPSEPDYRVKIDRFDRAIVAAREVLAWPHAEQGDSQIVFPNGIRAIHVDHIEKDVTVILTEAWSLLAIPSDSGLAVQVETKPLPYKDYPGTAKVTAKRMQPAPTVDDPMGLMTLRDVAKEAKRS